MKLGRIVLPSPDGPQSRIVAVLPSERVVVDLAAAERARLERLGASSDAARRLATALFPPSMAAAIAGGDAFLDGASRALESPHEPAVLDWSHVEWLSPIDPPVMLDASAFEQHLVNAHARGKREVPDYFYEVPVYYKMNPVTVIGHDALVPWPGDAQFMDFELELGLVIGSAASDLQPEEAPAHVFGITVMNDFSARDIQARESAAGFGPVKGKDFATALGPWITTMDEVRDLGDLQMLARVNDEELCRGSTSTLTWSLGEVVAFASRGEAVVPGEVIGSGTVGLGSGLELYRKLQPGDIVELEIESIGTLRNSIGPPVAFRWNPEPKARRAEVTLPQKQGR